MNENNRYPIDPSTVRFDSLGYIIADGRDEHEGNVFLFRETVSFLKQAHEISIRESVNGQFLSAGPGIDIKATCRWNKINFHPRGVGVWVKTHSTRTLQSENGDVDG